MTAWRAVQAARHPAEMAWSLRPGITCCAVADRLLFLDVDADRYFALGKPAELALQKIISGAKTDAVDERCLSALVARGIVLEAPGAHHEIATCPPPPSPETSMLDEPNNQGGPLAILIACVAIATSIRRIGKTPLRQNLEHSIVSRRVNERESDDGLVRIAQTYYRAGRLISAYDRCLPLSLAVMRATTARGYRTRLVLGVTLGPFAAHCWVQHGAMVVNDRVDRVRCYTPILVI